MNDVMIELAITRPKNERPASKKLPMEQIRPVRKIDTIEVNIPTPAAAMPMM